MVRHLFLPYLKQKQPPEHITQLKHTSVGLEFRQSVKELTPSSGGNEPWGSTLWLYLQTSSRWARTGIHCKTGHLSVLLDQPSTWSQVSLTKKQNVKKTLKTHPACMASHFRISCQACSLFLLWILMILLISLAARSSSRQRQLQHKPAESQNQRRTSILH